MKFYPTYSNVLIEILIGASEITKSGLIIQTKKEEAPTEGIVVEVGSDIEEATRIIPGAKVLFKKFAGDEVDLENGKKYIVIEADQIILVIEK